MTPAPWRVVPLETGPADVVLAEGLARFEALAADPTPTLRWYRSEAPAIVLGRGQARLAVDRDRHPVVARHSGGGAVWLTPDVLSLDVLLPAGHPWLTDELSTVFRQVGRRWRDALVGLGVDDLTVYDGPSTARRRGTAREQLLAAVCYATRGRGEVLWRRRKLVGLAQRRRRAGAMVQCGLLRRWEPRQLLTSLGAAPDDAEILSAAVGLEEATGGAAPDDRAVMAAVEAAFCS
jgi:lipoate-protein ligase A